jgi:hypothetical protein
MIYKLLITTVARQRSSPVDLHGLIAKPGRLLDRRQQKPRAAPITSRASPFYISLSPSSAAGTFDPDHVALFA